MAERREPPSKSFEEALGDFTDEARRSEAQRRRRQRHDNLVVGGLTGTFHGSLIEVAELGAPIVVITRNGQHIRGAVVAVGTDVVVMAPDGEGRRLLVALHAIEAIRGLAVAASRTEEGAELGPDMGSLLDEFAQDRARVALTTAGGNHLGGTLVAVGVDQVTLRLDGARDLGAPEHTTVSLHAIDEAVIDP